MGQPADLQRQNIKGRYSWRTAAREPTAEPSHIKTGAVHEPLCYQCLNEIY